MSDTANTSELVHSSLTPAAAEIQQQIIESSSATDQAHVTSQQEPTITDVTMSTSPESQPALDSNLAKPAISSSQEESKREMVTAIGEPGKQQAFVVRDAETMQKMMDSYRTLSGIKTVEEMKFDMSTTGGAEGGDGEDQVKKIIIPAEKFQEFKEITTENEEVFKYVINCIVT